MENKCNKSVLFINLLWNLSYASFSNRDFIMPVPRARKRCVIYHCLIFNIIFQIFFRCFYASLIHKFTMFHKLKILSNTQYRNAICLKRNVVSSFFSSRCYGDPVLITNAWPMAVFKILV